MPPAVSSAHAALGRDADTRARLRVRAPSAQGFKHFSFYLRGREELRKTLRARTEGSIFLKRAEPPL